MKNSFLKRSCAILLIFSFVSISTQLIAQRMDTRSIFTGEVVSDGIDQTCPDYSTSQTFTCITEEEPSRCDFLFWNVHYRRSSVNNNLDIRLRCLDDFEAVVMTRWVASYPASEDDQYTDKKARFFALDLNDRQRIEVNLEIESLYSSGSLVSNSVRTTAFNIDAPTLEMDDLLRATVQTAETHESSILLGWYGIEYDHDRRIRIERLSHGEMLTFSGNNSNYVFVAVYGGRPLDFIDPCPWGTEPVNGRFSFPLHENLLIPFRRCRLFPPLLREEDLFGPRIFDPCRIMPCCLTGLSCPPFQIRVRDHQRLMTRLIDINGKELGDIRRENGYSILTYQPQPAEEFFIYADIEKSKDNEPVRFQVESSWAGMDSDNSPSTSKFNWFYPFLLTGIAFLLTLFWALRAKKE